MHLLLRALSLFPYESMVQDLLTSLGPGIYLQADQAQGVPNSAASFTPPQLPTSTPISAHTTISPPCPSLSLVIKILFV